MKTGREAGAGAFAFLEVNDGSCFENVQVCVIPIITGVRALRGPQNASLCLPATLIIFARLKLSSCQILAIIAPPRVIP